ncbi:hypothetical protein EDD86DRAFT_246433 [Gorgonomyces haynaldii]|nr:hypothetical protein EDD86DRAFT_246433 [Gorgonomyces haynaldii]
MDCSFSADYPRHYVALYGTPVIDGFLDDPIWSKAPWTQDFVDISTSTVPRFQTKTKILYDDSFLYIGAYLQETQFWANITASCHCIDPQQDQVVFHDNDFEVFVDPDGSNHFYKELEVNQANVDWVLMLNKPYENGGYENSTRLLKDGYTIRKRALKVQTEGRVNDPQSNGSYWSVEMALPIDELLHRTLGQWPKDDVFWRINFSRVEWHVDVVDGKYVKTSPVEDNWVWSPQGFIQMHYPEFWGVLQFSQESLEPKTYPEFPIRRLAMLLYYAQDRYKQQHGRFTMNVQDLNEPGLDCASFVGIWLKQDGYEAVVKMNGYKAVIHEDRLLRVTKVQESLNRW